MENCSFYVYQHIRYDTNEIIYVGKGKGRRAYNFINRNKLWLDIKSKTNIKVEILIKDIENEFAILIERDVIESYKFKKINLVNINIGGAGDKKYSHSDEIKKKISESHKGKKRPLEVMEKMWQASRGKPKSEQHKLNLAKSHIGKKLSLEHRKKISEGGFNRWKKIKEN